RKRLYRRGNFEGFFRAASKQKWLEVHGIEHWTHFYTDYGVNLQKRFFGHFLKDPDSSRELPGSNLKGERHGWDAQPKVQLQVRHVDRFVERHENEWPIARTQWTKMYLHADGQLKSSASQESKITFEAMGDGLTFVSEPMKQQPEITGPLAAKRTVSSTTADADLFLVFRVFTADFREVTFMGA